jgi:transposase
MKLDNNNHSVFLLYYHLVLVVKYRRKVFSDRMSQKEKFPWLKEVDSLALANAQINLNKAYNNFWSNRKHFGKPRFKSKKTGHASYSTNNQHGSVRIEGNKVKLPISLKQEASASIGGGTFTRRIIIFGSLYDKYLYYSQILRK